MLVFSQQADIFAIWIGGGAHCNRMDMVFTVQPSTPHTLSVTCFTRRRKLVSIIY